MVRHEVDDEVVRRGSDKRGAEERREVVRVVVDGIQNVGILVLTELVESVPVFVAAQVIDLFEAGDVEGVCVAVVEVGVGAANACVAFVFVVGVADVELA